MRIAIFTSLIATAALAMLQVARAAEKPVVSIQTPDGLKYTISDSYTHDNLTIFLLHGADRLKGKVYLTLAEALEQKKVIVYETANVNELSIENVGDEDVFVQQGDIVKGGQQDRTIGTDLICGAHSGKMPIAAFCVENGRWEGRGNEPSSEFVSAGGSIAGVAMKQAANANYSSNSQSNVWQQVASNQAKLSSNAGTNVQATTSPSSFQLTLENKEVQAARDAYVKQLEPVVAGQSDVVGYLYAVNGTIAGGDVYASSALFQKLWPKLIRSASVEAFAELKKDQKFEPATVEAAKAFIEKTESAQGKPNQVNDRVTVDTKDAADSILFDTHDKRRDDASIHREYLRKQKENPGSGAMNEDQHN
jgi:hypothetical protein